MTFNDRCFRELQEKELKLCLEKNKAYGKQNISKFGLDGVIIRMNDKMERLINLAFNKSVDSDKLNTFGVKVCDESVLDTLMDISNYANIAIMVATSEW